MTTNELIKALERMSKEDPEGFSNDILAFINRQKAEYDELYAFAAELKDKAELLEIEKSAMQHKIDSQKAEIERWWTNYTLPKEGFFNVLCGALVYTKTLEEYNQFRRTIKAETIKEFAERLKRCCYTHSDICGHQSTVIDVEDIDNLVKEMVGDK